jgi:group I intron endonuclease
MKIYKRSVYSNNSQYTPDCAAIIYKTINLINNKMYIGSRKLGGYKKNLDPFYLGSNELLKRAAFKYGDNFQRIILEEINDLSILSEREEYYLKINNCAESKEYYNFCNNFYGGDTFSFKDEKSKNITREKQRENAIKRNSVANIQNPEVIELNRQRCLNNNPMKFKTTKEIQSFNIQMQPVKIVFEDGKEYCFSGIKEAARQLGFKESTVKYRVRVKPNEMINGWIINKI